MRKVWIASLKTARRVVIAVVGGSVILFGVVLLFTPGPAIVVIPIGLAILASEFVWARRLLRKVRDRANSMLSRDGGTSHPSVEP